MAELLERKKPVFESGNFDIRKNERSKEITPRNSIRNPRNKWKVCISDPFMNCERIYPIQQKKISQIVNDLKQDENIKKIVIFGSSVTDRCHAGSDVDLYIELEENRKVLSHSYDFLFDLWTNYTVDFRMKQEIDKKGVTVYEK